MIARQKTIKNPIIPTIMVKMVPLVVSSFLFVSPKTLGSVLSVGVGVEVTDGAGVLVGESVGVGVLVGVGFLGMYVVGLAVGGGGGSAP